MNISRVSMNVCFVKGFKVSAIRRDLFTSCIHCKITPHSLKGKSVSSQQWLKRQLNDPYVKKARYQNYRARSAFKLIEIDDKYHLIEPGMVVIDCGASPGAFTQVIVERLGFDSETKKLNGMAIAVDLNAISEIPGAHVLPNTDLTKPLSHAKIIELLEDRKADLVCSDMAPNATGTKFFDHEAIITLSLTALRLAVVCLKPETGAFLTKIWDGGQVDILISQMEKFFETVNRVKPPSSRCDSSEWFVLGRKFKGIKT